MLKVGDIAPDFELSDQTGATQSLDELVAQGRVYLYFYPVDFSPVCTAQACAVRDRAPDAAESGVQIVGISPQSVASHQRFAALNNIRHPLLSDRNKRVIRAYGVDGPFGMGVRRVTYLIESDRTIGRRVVSDLMVSPHTQLFADIQAPV